jgi:ABC-type polysaccharide/polyol phosphate transport system ATPase subunit
MSSDIVISVRQVSKAYRIWASPPARLISPAWQLLARACPRRSSLRTACEKRAGRGYRDFYALNDISFDVRKGECLGIIGRNGAGKSTLLQLIAGTLRPTAGEMQVRGRVAALLELGSGFDPEFTGRENVFLNATILGLTRAQIEERLDDILGFAEIGAFIDQPVKVYSSGMTVRLAFAVVAHVDADIMIIDEALSVGDARFQLKCARAIDRFIERGVTLLFVSHGMTMIKRLCTRAILIEQGLSVFAGKPNTVVNLYSKLLADGGSLESIAGDLETLKQQSDEEPALAAAAAGGRSSPPSSSSFPRPSLPPPDPSPDPKASQLIADERAHVQVSGHEYSYGGELGAILAPAMQGENGEERTWFATGEAVTVSMTAEAREKLPEPIYALTLKNESGQEVYGTNTFYTRQTAPAIQPGERHRVTFRFNMNLVPGTYFVSLGWTYFVGDELVVIHRRYDVMSFEVHGRDRVFGIANLWAVIDVNSDL